MNPHSPTVKIGRPVHLQVRMNLDDAVQLCDILKSTDACLMTTAMEDLLYTTEAVIKRLQQDVANDPNDPAADTDTPKIVPLDELQIDQYTKLKSMGLLFVIYPNATGDRETDGICPF